MYYLQAIASAFKGSFYINLNTKLYNSTLNGKVSSMIKTEEQKIDITSTIIQETTVLKAKYLNLILVVTIFFYIKLKEIFYNETQRGYVNATAELQVLELFSDNSCNFILNFDGANTCKFLGAGYIFTQLF